MNIKFVMRQWVKMAVQNLLLPLVYQLCKKKNINKRKVIFADAHHNRIPYSMEFLRGQMDESEWDIDEFYLDYQGNSFGAVLKSMLSFMKAYANARCVFICDNFLPVSSCNKRRETTVVQLWHAGGILKKYAYDTPDDIPTYYKGHVYKNYDITTVSAPICVPVYERAMRLEKGTVSPIGLSRTDLLFKETYIEECRREFYAKYPEAEGKRVVLFAPTFRGKASDPYLAGGEWIEGLEEKLNSHLQEGENPYKVYMRVHPHLDNKKKLSNIEIDTNRLLPVIDLLISDVSSVIFDYVLLEKPMVLFIPDLEELESARGFYIPLREIPGVLVTEGELLEQAVRNTVNTFSEDVEMQRRLHDFRKTYMGACDGQATERLLVTVQSLHCYEQKSI